MIKRTSLFSPITKKSANLILGCYVALRYLKPNGSNITDLCRVLTCHRQEPGNSPLGPKTRTGIFPAKVAVQKEHFR